MAEGLKLVNDIFNRAKEQQKADLIAYYGIVMAVVVLSDPRNADLLERLVEYCEEPSGEEA